MEYSAPKLGRSQLVRIPEAVAGIGRETANHRAVFAQRAVQYRLNGGEYLRGVRSGPRADAGPDPPHERGPIDDHPDWVPELDGCDSAADSERQRRRVEPRFGVANHLVRVGVVAGTDRLGGAHGDEPRDREIEGSRPDRGEIRLRQAGQIDEQGADSLGYRPATSNARRDALPFVMRFQLAIPRVVRRSSRSSALAARP